MHQFQVAASSLHVRKGPAVTFPSIGGLKQGDVVDQLDKSGDGYWMKVKKGTLEGWSSHKYLQPIVSHGVVAEGFPWMPVALAEVGVKEFTGAGDNPRIVEYLRSTNLAAPSSSNDETFWCSAFVNWCVERSGLEGTDSAWALSWSTWGKKLSEPKPGCIAVFTRPGGGHVGFFTGQTAKDVKLLGGNQQDAVSISPRPKTRLVGYRSPL